MIRNLHHPSCPAGHEAGRPCICPPARNVAAEALAFAGMLALVAGVPLYLLWRVVA